MPSTAKKPEPLEPILPGDDNKTIARKRGRVGRAGIKKQETIERFAAMVHYVSDLLAKGAYKHEIKLFLRKRHGNLSARTIERVLSRARLSLTRAAGVTTEQVRGEADAFYRSMIRSPTATNAEKLLAMQLRVRLFKAEAPVEINVNHSGGVGVGITADEVHRRVRELLEEKKANRYGSDGAIKQIEATTQDAQPAQRAGDQGSES